MYYEVWIDERKKDDVRKTLEEVCSEVHEVCYDYHFIVNVSSEENLKIDGVKYFRKHYSC